MKPILFLYLLLLICSGAVQAKDNIEDVLDLTTRHAGSAKNRDDACMLAQSKASQNGRVVGECTCEKNRREIYICYVDSTQADLRSATIAPSNAPPRPEQKPSKAQCDTLIRFRDAELLSSLDFALKKHDSIVHKSLPFLEKVRQESTKLRERQPSMNAAFQLVLLAKTTAEAIGDILKIDPATGVAVGATRGISGMLLNQNLTTSLLTENLEPYIAQEIANSGMAGAALAATYNLTKNMKAHAEAYKDGNQILDAIDDSLGSLNRVIQKQEAALKNTDFKLKIFNEFQNDIAKACR